MRWRFGYRRTDLSGWYSWFAWHPVWLTDRECWVWLEWTQRRRTVDRGAWYGDDIWGWEYQQVAPEKRWPA